MLMLNAKFLFTKENNAEMKRDFDVQVNLLDKLKNYTTRSVCITKFNNLKTFFWIDFFYKYEKKFQC